MPYPSEKLTMEENVEGDVQEGYLEDLVEAKIETALVRYEYAPVRIYTEKSDETFRELTEEQR